MAPARPTNPAPPCHRTARSYGANLTAMQFGFSAVVAFLLGAIGLVEVDKLEMSKVLKFLPAVILFYISIARCAPPPRTTTPPPATRGRSVGCPRSRRCTGITSLVCRRVLRARDMRLFRRLAQSKHNGPQKKNARIDDATPADCSNLKLLHVSNVDTFIVARSMTPLITSGFETAYLGRCIISPRVFAPLRASSHSFARPPLFACVYVRGAGCCVLRAPPPCAVITLALRSAGHAGLTNRDHASPAAAVWQPLAPAERSARSGGDRGRRTHVRLAATVPPPSRRPAGTTRNPTPAPGWLHVPIWQALLLPNCCDGRCDGRCNGRCGG